MRRFILVNEEQPDQAVGEGVVWSCDPEAAPGYCVSVHWREAQQQLGYEFRLEAFAAIEELLQEEHSPEGKLTILWIDPVYSAPHPVQRSVNNGPFEAAVQIPTHRLQDGWGEPNGVVDRKGVPLHVGQLVKLLTGGYEGCGDVGEITSFTIYENGRLRICLAGVSICNMADVTLDEIEAIETTTKQTLERHGGRKPTWSWQPTIMIPPT